MELRVLKYFIKIAEEENMTKAAQKLHVSQPALSKQMKELENEIGHLLFVRNKQRMVLTEKGMLLKKRAESILMLVDKTVDELNNDELLVGNIYIGTGQTDNLDEIMEIIKQFRNHYPFVKFHIHSGDKYSLLNDIENGLLDFGVFIREYDKKYYEGIRLNLQNELGLWVSKDHFLADKNVIEATNLKDISLVVAHQAINDGEVPSFISDDQIIGTYDLIENARVIVKHNLASALVINKEDYDPDLKFIHIKNMPQYHWYMIWKKESKTKLKIYYKHITQISKLLQIYFKNVSIYIDFFMKM